jgi:hypothetical protein
MSKHRPYAYRRRTPDDLLEPCELKELIRHLEANLSSERFLARAPNHVIESTRNRLSRVREYLAEPRIPPEA